MISIYLLIAIICAILLFISAFFGGIADMDIDVDVDVDADLGFGDFGGAGISPLSGPVILVFGLVFGSTGVIFEELEFGRFVVPLLAVVCAVIATVATYAALVKVFMKTQATSEVKLDDLIGLEGETTMPVKPDQPGQVMVITDARGRTLLAAHSDQEIPTNAMVTIKGVIGNGVKVEKKTGGA